MTLDGFLTVLGLAAAIYAVVPAVPRLRARLALAIQAPVAVLALMAVLYFEFFTLVGRPCALPWGQVCAAITLHPQGLQPAQAAFLVVLVWMPLAWIIHKLARPGASALPAVRRLVDEMIYEQRFAELIAFVEPYLPLIDDAASRRLPLQRLSDRSAQWRGRRTDDLLTLELSFPEGGETVSIPARHERPRLLSIARRLVAWLPRQERAEEAAEDIIRALLNAPGLRKFVVEMRPYFGVPLMKISAGRPDEFTELYLADLLSHRGSVIYQELRQNQNFLGMWRYYIPERNRLLSFLLADARVAERLHAYRPVGEHTLKVLQTGRDDPYAKRLNSKPERFDEERWQDPVWAALFFFDIMVKEAAFQGITWHMWLYYIPLIVEALEASYDETGEGIDPSDEHPTIGAFLLYHAFDMLGDWVKLIEGLPADSPHRQIQTAGSYQNDNIPKSAALALGRSLSTIIVSTRISDQFKTYLMEIVVRDIKGLKLGSPIRMALIRAVVTGGVDFPNSGYQSRLRAAFGEIDYYLRSEVADLATAISPPGTSV